jgi:hypothetical protein
MMEIRPEGSKKVMIQPSGLGDLAKTGKTSA